MKTSSVWTLVILHFLLGENKETRHLLIIVASILTAIELIFS